jgi:hypothetical protein
MPAMPEGEPAHWIKSSRSSGNGACVEVAYSVDGVAVRDSKDPSGPNLRLEAESWRAFVDAVRRGELDLP